MPRQQYGGMADTATFAAVDLSRLPAPAVVETLTYESIYADMLADLQSKMPDFDATVESDPAVKLLQVAAYREFLLRARVNDAALAVMPAFATGSDLDQLAALLGIERLLLDPGDAANGIAPTYESDDAFRRRMVLAPEGYSVAGPLGAYIFHALSADPDVLDASASSPEPDDIRALVLQVLADNDAAPALVDAMTAALDAADWPGDVTVTILSRTGDGTPPAGLTDIVAAWLSAETRRPLTDHVTVQAAEIVDYTIDATVITYAGPDPAIVLAEARSRLDTYVARCHNLGLDVTRSGIFGALHVEGVQNVELASPAADIVVERKQATWCAGITITPGGVGE